MNKYKYLTNFIKGGLTVLISVFIISSVVYAGTITPPSGTPVAQFYTLSEIYEFITNNTTATAGGHGFTFGDALVGTGNTLTQIYDALVALISADKVKSGTTYLNIAGTLTPDGGTGAVADLFNSKTAHLTADWALDTGTLDLACNTATFDGTANLVADGYDGVGDGTNRFCITASGDAVAGDILSGKIAWIDGLEVTGTIPTQTLSVANDTVSAGYYDATTLSAVDTDLTAGNILSGTTIFGVAGSVSAGYTYGDSSQAYVLGTATGAGTALLNLWNGSLTTGGFDGGSQANGGVDDYNNNNAAGLPTGTYSKGWTQCNAGNSYCGTSDSGADAKDNSTGLVWSLPCNGSGCASFSDATPLTYSWDNSAVNNNSRTASQLCSDHTGWSLPHQKQLMQAYIDGSWDKDLGTGLEGVSRDYWSATTGSTSTYAAWYVNLSSGYTRALNKVVSNGVRCVR